MVYSKNSRKKYFFNKMTKESTYEMPPNSAAPFQYVMVIISFSHNQRLGGITRSFLLPQCVPLGAALLGLGGGCDSSRFTDTERF